MKNGENFKQFVKLTSDVASIKTGQDNLHEKLDKYIADTQERQAKLEHVVYGNGSSGLSEEVRGLKGKWAAFFGVILLVLSAVVNRTIEATTKGW